MPEMTLRVNPDLTTQSPTGRPIGEPPPAGDHETVLHIPVSAGLDQRLRTFAKRHGIQPATAAREAIRAYVGDDQ